MGEGSGKLSLVPAGGIVAAWLLPVRGMTWPAVSVEWTRST